MLTGIQWSDYGRNSFCNVEVASCPSKESSSLTFATGRRKLRGLMDIHGEGGKADSCTNLGRHRYYGKMGIKV